MVIVLKKGIPEKDKNNLKSFLERNHFRVNEIKGDEDTIFGVVGKMSIDPREVEIIPGVERVIPISKPYKMASREFKRDDTIIELPTIYGSSVKLGGMRVCAIAGPCAVESREQIMEAAQAVAKAGAVMLRGGAYKPRTSPYAFQGMGEAGVKILREAGDSVGLPIVTEIVSTEHIPVFRDYVDVLQIGARNMQNFELLKKVGALGKPVILKRGLSATIEEWLMAAEYLLDSGTNNVILCERGIRTYEKATRNTLDLSAIPVLRSLTHLPIIVDPSHAVGIRDKVSPLALASVAAGADGIIVEVHCCPDQAMSDGAQSLYPEQFDKLMRDIEVLAPVVGKEIARLPKKLEHFGYTGSVSLDTGEKSVVEGNSNSCRALGSGDQLGSAEPDVAAEKITCAFSGGRGAYAEQAIAHYFDENAKSVPCESFRDVFKSVLDGRARYGMIPIENSLAGSVYENYDNLFRFEDVEIVGGLKLRIEHMLLALSGTQLADIKYVYSHPQGFAQCADFLQQHSLWRHIESISTATAAQTVAQLNSNENAAIASEHTAALYKLSIIKQGIESDPQNYTRFVIITAKKMGHDTLDHVFTKLDPRKKAKAALVFSTKNTPGALYGTLGIIQKYQLNLAHLESRPIPGQPWRYMFYADVELEAEQRGSLVHVLQELKYTSADSPANEIRILGIFNELN